MTLGYFKIINASKKIKRYVIETSGANGETEKKIKDGYFVKNSWCYYDGQVRNVLAPYTRYDIFSPYAEGSTSIEKYVCIYGGTRVNVTVLYADNTVESKEITTVNDCYKLGNCEITNCLTE